MKCDVLVLGGGGAGLCAAVAAARAGARTVLSSVTARSAGWPWPR
jgi:succinate dehydrogenase/fumarate reductase flavoprotein subunit